MPDTPAVRPWLAAPSRRGWPSLGREERLETIRMPKSRCRETRQEQPQECPVPCPCPCPCPYPFPYPCPCLPPSISPERPAGVSWLRDPASNIPTSNLSAMTKVYTGILQEVNSPV